MYRTALYEAYRRCPARFRPTRLRLVLIDMDMVMDMVVIGRYEAEAQGSHGAPVNLVVTLPPGWQWLKQDAVNRLVWYELVAAMQWD